MSVFQLQEWWSVKISQAQSVKTNNIEDSEEFDQGCFVVGNIDNALPITNKILIGSLQGALRMYNPVKPNYRVEDLVLEEMLNAPILQILLGRFIPGSELLGVAILHPRELVVYEIVPQAVKDERVSYYSMRKVYQHDLGIEGKHFTAFNMVSGAFGGARGRDMIMVQSLDGKLQIFEQSAHAFSRQLVDCLLPGPLVYVPKLDAFVTVNYAGIAECYRYQVLASSQSEHLTLGRKAEGKTDDLRSIKASGMEWSTNLGECARQILVGNLLVPGSDVNESKSASVSTGSSELLFVCDKSIFLVKAETGGIIQQRRVEKADGSCAALVPYVAEISNGKTTNAYNFILADKDGTIQVYTGFNLVWAARLPSSPVHLVVSSFGGQKGLIVSVDDKGSLAVSYLGTKPPIQTMLSQVRDLDYDKIDEEHRSLLQVIRESQCDRVEPSEKLLIKSQVSRSFDLEHHGDFELPSGVVQLFSSRNNMIGNGDNLVKMTVRLYLTYTGDRPATNVSIVISPPAHIHAVPNSIILQKVTGVRSTPVVVKVQFFAMKSLLASSLDVVVTASYQTQRGEPQVAVHHLPLPMHIACRPKAPSKTAACKVILDTDFPAISLTDLFGDLLFAYQESGFDVADMLGGNAVQAMGFQTFNNTLTVSNNTGTLISSDGSSLVSILVSRNAGRYRLQADSYPALYLVFHELEKRLQLKLEEANSGVKAQLVKCADPLPLDEYFLYIKQHLDLRYELVKANDRLKDVAQQYRVIQKRLLVRFKDKNPTSLNGLDALLHDTYNKLISIADEVETTMQRLTTIRAEIECFSKLLAGMAAVKFGLGAADRAALQSYLCPEIRDGADQGWEETVTASLMLLLKTSLAKQAKESTSMAINTLEMPKNIEQLRKNLMLVFDRLEKGARIVSGVVST